MSSFAKDLSVESQIDSPTSFNRFCQEACRLWERHFGQHGIGHASTLFQEQLRRVERGGPEVIQTSWGGVAIELHEHPRVEKYLVIRKGDTWLWRPTRRRTSTSRCGRERGSCCGARRAARR